MNAKTSDRVSSIAARYANLTPARLLAATAKDSTLEAAVDDIKSMAASLMRQDEVRGVRRLLKLVTG
jgi:hypothetical protein